MNSALAALIGLILSIVLIIRKLSPVYSLILGALVGGFIILTESPIKALVFIIFIVVLQQIEGNIIYPKVVGFSIGLPGIWVLAAITIGGGIFGIYGMLIAVPLAATVYKLLKERVNRAPLNPETAEET